MKVFHKLVLLAASLAFFSAHAKVSPGDAAPDFTLTSAKGNSHSLSDFKGKYVVLEWVNHGCPFVKKHYDVGNMQMLQKKYTGKDVVWLSICSSAEGKQGYMTPAEIIKAREAVGAASTAYLIDEAGTVGKAYGARRTPEMFIVDPEGMIVYHGAIDSNPSASSDTIDGATNYVMVALEAAMAGKPIEQPVTRPYGCSVKY